MEPFNIIRMPIESISSFASKTLPILKHHYEMTVIIRDAISKAEANQGGDPLKLSDKMKIILQKTKRHHQLLKASDR